MTPKERSNPDLFMSGRTAQSRKQRVARGSGQKIDDVNRLMKQFDQTRKMMRMVSGSNMKNMMAMANRMKGMPGMPKM